MEMEMAFHVRLVWSAFVVTAQLCQRCFCHSSGKVRFCF